MVKHMIVWKFKDELENKAARAKEIQQEIKTLKGRLKTEVAQLKAEEKGSK